MDELHALQAIADRAGAVFLLLLFIIALWRRYIVMGWSYSDCTSERDVCRKIASDRAAKLESDLDRLRDERRRE